MTQHEHKASFPAVEKVKTRCLFKDNEPLCRVEVKSFLRVEKGEGSWNKEGGNKANKEEKGEVPQERGEGRREERLFVTRMKRAF